MNSKERRPTLMQHCVAGIVAGGVSTAALYPLDLVKVRYQVHEQSPRAYRSLFHAFTSLLKAPGSTHWHWRAMYTGMSPALYGTTMSWGLYFYFYEHAKTMYANSTIPPSIGHFLSGIQAGVLCVPLTNPIWLIKVRMQVQGTQVPYKSVSDAFRRIVAEEGIAALYKGVVPALLLTTHGAFKFVAYEKLKSEYYEHVSKDMTIPASLTIGAFSQAFASAATYPYQVIKARLQQGGPSADKYKGTWDCTKRIIKYEGVTGFFKGLTPNLIKVMPNGALIFAVYEYMSKLLMKADQDSLTM
ncbi:mitochondrial folate transporter/carrier [Thraustotheca clavata]|uniref:Mitochondrial folate transporter/carrier n=1 Tax=Thraustotheca clavata TaxID=74557 RepID=A0A1W0A9M0_9STRA|nr:mitochondrial folate transporter/carrier [Thraustotheca clavata]